MPEKEKLSVKITVTMTPQDKQNLDADIPILEQLLKDRVGTEITVALFLRLCARDLHEQLASGAVINWPPRLETQKRRTKKNT